MPSDANTDESFGPPVRPNETRDRWWFTPAFLVLAPVAASFLAWFGMIAWCSEGVCAAGSMLQLRGFIEPSAITIPGVLLLFVWYGTLVLVATVGWRLGAETEPIAEIVQRTWTAGFERRYFQLVLATAFVGVAYSFYKIAGSTSILDSLKSQTGNSFTNSLSGSAGLATLRYATIIAAPVSIYLWRKRTIGLPYVVLAVGLLLLNSTIAHRLALVMASVVYVAISITAQLGSRRARSRAPRALVIIVGFVIAFSTLAALNFIRNANYYRAAGVTNPAAMNIYQMGSYLGVPAQVSLGVADAVMRGDFERPGSPVGSIAAIEPSFFVTTKVRKDDVTPENSEYGYAVSFAPNFTTNSAFADMYGQFGRWGLLYSLFAYAVAGYLFGRFLRYGPVIAGTGGVLAYCMVEVWRIQLVSQGIIVFLILLSIGCAFVAASARTSGLVDQTDAAREGAGP